MLRVGWPDFVVYETDHFVIYKTDLDRAKAAERRGWFVRREPFPVLPPRAPAPLTPLWFWVD